jgi:RluA family pseudouridine synthase
MPLKKFSLKTQTQHQKQRLDQVLTEWLPRALGQPISKGKARKLIIAGAVYLNGRRVRIASKELMSNASIDVFVDLNKLNSEATQQDILFKMSEDRILYEDPFLIAINKPPGLPTQPTLDEARDNLFVSVKKYLAKRSGTSEQNVYLGLHHRLDRDTSGVILLTKSTEANPGVAALFSQHQANKVYQALAFAAQRPPENSTWEVKNYLAKLKTGGKKTKMGSVRSGGDFAHTSFSIIQEYGNAFWIEAALHTGRMHQIRVHLSEGKMPILGDLTYGGNRQVGGVQIPRLMLHASSLTFKHPILQNKVSIQSPLPEDFGRCLKALQKEFTDS